RPHEQAGPAGKAGSRFTGEVYPCLTHSVDAITVNTVTFAPGARTHWHDHEDGQLLLVLSGRGVVQAADEEVQVLHAGDTVWAPAGESHWHGAAAASALTHIAISLGATRWADEVAASDYAGANSEVRG